MSGTKRILYQLTGNGVDANDPEAMGFWINRLVTPIAKALLSLVNRLAADVRATTTDITLTGAEGFVPVDATAGPVTITLSSPLALFHLLIVQKVDASGNAVTVAAPSGVTLSGGLPLAAQWDRLIIVADDSAFYA